VANNGPNTSQKQEAATLSMLGQVGCGEYRIESDEVRLLNHFGCAVVQEVIGFVSRRNQEEVIAHKSLKIDLGVGKKAFAEIRKLVQIKYGIELPQSLTDSLSVWDCYDRADRQLRVEYIEAELDKVETNLNSSDKIGPSLELAERLKRLSLATIHEENELVARCQYWLGTALVMMGKLKPATDCFEHALDIRKRLHGPRDLRVAATLHNIAVVQGQLGNYEQAEKTFREAIAICDEQLGKDFPDTQLITKNLASMLHRAGRLEEAVPILQKALGISERSLGRTHRQTATTLASLATVLADQGQLEEAEARLRESLELCDTVIGRDSLQSAAIRNNLAIVLSRQGHYEQALGFAEQAMNDMVKRVGLTDPLMIAIRNNMAVIREKISAGAGEEDWQLLAEEVRKYPADDRIRSAVLQRQLVSLPVAA